MRRTIRRALLSVYDKTGPRRARAGPARPRRRARVVGQHRGRARRGGLAGDAGRDVTGLPEMLDDRVKTLHPKIHGGLLADLGKESHLADLERHDIQPFELVVSNLYPFLERPGIETIDIGGPAMTRASAKNHAWVTIVTEPDQYDAAARRAARERRDGRRRDATRVRARSVRPHGRVRRRDRAVVAGRRGAAAASRARARAHRRARCATARTRTSRPRATARRGAHELVGRPCSSTAGSRSRTSTSTTPTRRGSSCTISASAPACAIIKHANPCGVARRRPNSRTRTNARSSATSESAFGGIVAFNRPIDAATVDAMVAGPQADVVIAPGYAPGAIEALRGEAQEHAHPRSRRRPVASRSTSARSPAASSSRTPHHFAATRDDVARRHQGRADDRAVARPRARVAHLRSREVERDRARQGRPGGRHRRRSAEPRRVGRDRGPEGRGPGPRAARPRATRFYPFPDGVEAAAAAGVAAVIQPGGGDERRAVIETADELGPRDGVHRRTALPPLMTRDRMLDGNAFARSDVKDDLRGAHQGARRARHHARARHDPRRRRPEQRGVRPRASTPTPPRSASSRSTSSSPTTATQAELLARDRRVQRRPRRRRVPRAGPVAEASRRRRPRSCDRPRQGRRRAAPGQPRAARAWASPAPRPCTPLGHPGAARALRGPDRGPARRRSSGAGSRSAGRSRTCSR